MCILVFIFGVLKWIVSFIFDLYLTTSKKFSPSDAKQSHVHAYS